MEGDLKRNATVSPMAGKTSSQEMLVDVTRREREYFERLPDVEDPTQLVSFGTSGHRGSSLRGSFTRLMFWPSLRPSATTGEPREQPVRSITERKSGSPPNFFLPTY